MTRHNDYHGPERRAGYQQTRKMVLTTDDMTAIAAIVSEHHVCRYDVEPEEMRDIVKFVRDVKDNVEDYRKGVRKTVIRLAAIGTVMWVIYVLEVKFPFLRPLLKYLKG